MCVVRSLLPLALVGACAEQHAHDGPVGPPEDEETSDAATRKDGGAAQRDADRADGDAANAEVDATLAPGVCAPLVLTLSALDAGDPCVFQLSRVPDPAYLHVELDGMPLARDEADGWVLMESILVLRGKACDLLEDHSKRHTLSAKVGCIRQ